MVAAAEKLVDEGLPVTSIHATADAYVNPGQYDASEDVEGSIDFTHAFQHSVFPQGETGLHWAGASGWCLFLVTSGRSFYEGARWMGAGLTPSPERVAAFLSSARLDPLTVGSAERPFYRTPGEGLIDLLERLGEFTPASDGSYEYRFRHFQGERYRRRVLEALASGNDDIIDLPLRWSELTALLHLLEHAETGPSSVFGPDDFTSRLGTDLARRVGSGHAGVTEHQSSVAHARVVKERMEERRRRDGGAECPGGVPRTHERAGPRAEAGAGPWPMG